MSAANRADVTSMLDQSIAIDDKLAKRPWDTALTQNLPGTQSAASSHDRTGVAETTGRPQ